MIRLNCFFTLADEEKKKAFVSLAQELVEKSRTDAGCIAYDILFSCTNPLTGMICETWQDQASLDLHAHAEHTPRATDQSPDGGGDETRRLSLLIPFQSPLGYKGNHYLSNAFKAWKG